MSEWSENRVVVFVCCALALLVAGAYYPVFGHDFVYFDDPRYVFENTHVRGGLSWEGVRWAFSTFHAANWHPLTWISHMADVSLFGIDPGMHHLVNVVLHLANSVLLFLVIRAMTGAAWKSGMIAALFAVHPLHVESVAWIAERKDVLSTFFGLLAMGGYIAYARRPAALRYAGVIVLYALSLLSKPMLVTLPFLLVLLDYWPLGRILRQGAQDTGEPVARIVLEKIPLLLLSIASCAVTYVAQNAGEAVASIESVSFWMRVGNGLYSYIGYILKMVWPAGLAPFYPHPLESLSLAWAVGSGLLVLALSAGAVAVSRRYRYFPVGWFWYLGTLVPVIGLVQVGGQAMADRYTYFPMIGLFVVIAFSAGDLFERFGMSRRVVAAVCVVPLIALSAVTWRQVGYWKDSRAMYARSLEISGENWQAHYFFGVYEFNRGNLPGAIARFSEVVRLRPQSAGAHNYLGVLYGKAGRRRDALAHLREARWNNPESAEINFNLGAVELQEGDLDEARIYLEEAVRLKPDYAAGWNALGKLAVATKNYAEAIRMFRQAIELGYRPAGVYNDLSISLVETGALAEARACLEEAFRVDPAYSNAHFNMGRVSALMGDDRAAIIHFNEALRLSPGDAAAMYNLALVYGRAGRFDSAATFFREVIDLHPEDAEARARFQEAKAGKNSMNANFRD